MGSPRGDGRAHAVSVYYANTAQLVVNTEDQAVVWSRDEIGNLTVLRMGSEAQPVLAKSGDDLRIDWGYLYVAAPASATSASSLANGYLSSAKRSWRMAVYPVMISATRPFPRVKRR